MERDVLMLARERGVIRPRDLEERGIPRHLIYRLADRGELARVGRGLYAAAGAEISREHTLVEVARVVPDGVVCLLSALRFHELTTQGPAEVWLAIENKAWRPRGHAWPLRLVFMSGDAFRSGVEAHRIEGAEVKVYSAAKTVADCFKFRNKIGTDIAVEALRDFVQRFPDGSSDLWRFAGICRVRRVMAPYLEAIG
jgi:predicted transcriptional regulator of viral defense system